MGHYTVEYYKAKKRKNLPFATAWVDLRNIKQSEVRQSEKDMYHLCSLMCGI